MGQLKSDGRATNFKVPDATALVFGDLYRVNGWNLIAMENVAAQTPGPNIAGEISSERIWYIKVPAGLVAAVGDLLNWSTGAGFKRGDTDLVVASTATSVGPCAKVEEAKDANNYVGVRVLNVVNAIT